MIDQISKIFELIGTRIRWGIIGLLFLMVCSAGLELCGIGMFFPLLTLLSSPDLAMQNKYIVMLSDLVGIESKTHFIVGFSFAIFVFFIFKSSCLAFVIFLQNRYVTKHRALYAQSLLRQYLDRPYIFHLQRNSAELVRNITLLASRLFIKGLLPLLQITMEMLVMLGMLIALIIVDPIATLLMVLVLGGSIGVFYVLLRRKLREWGSQTIKFDAEIFLWITQAIGSIKETKLYRHEKFFEDTFAISSNSQAHYLARTTTVPHLPRLLVETVAVGAMAILVALILVKEEGNIVSAIPNLGVFTIVSIRLIPSLSRLVGAFTTLRDNVASVNSLYDDLQESSESVGGGWHEKDSSSRAVTQHQFTFEREIRLSAISYNYPGSSEKALEGINLCVERGKTVAVVGGSGAGKTTLVDLMLGLLKPTHGYISVDGRDVYEDLPGWQSLIAYIPQDIYIIDNSLRQNVVLGQTNHQIDEGRLNYSLSLAQLDKFVSQLPDGLDTVLGEGGARLSGGQRQRIGIARAIYHNPEVLVMDEATSALDSVTEREITDSIGALSGKMTIIVIAHRLSTVQHCDRIFLLENGQLADEGAFSELANRNPNFRRNIELSDIRLAKEL